MLQTGLLRAYFYFYEENIKYVGLALLYIQKGFINKQASYLGTKQNRECPLRSQDRTSFKPSSAAGLDLGCRTLPLSVSDLL